MRQVFWDNGNIKREGTFGTKGLVNGCLYYESGKLRFKGEVKENSGYGPNYPIRGTVYSEDGKVLYNGEFKVLRSGLGYPTIEEPKGLIKCPEFMARLEDEDR